MASVLLKRAVLNHNKLLSHSPFTFSGVGICHLAQAIEGDAHFSLEGVDRGGYCRMWPIGEMATRSRRKVLHTDFISPPVLETKVMSISSCERLKIIAQGGYREAERCRISFGNPELLTSVPDIVAAVSISGDFGFQPCTHGDFRASILGTGIPSEKVGDILLLGEKGAHVYVVPEVADFLITSLDKVGNVPVTCKKMPLNALEYESPRIQNFKTLVASNRIDSIASAGFKISRAKIVRLISDGDVRVNSVTVRKNHSTTKSGDIITVTGKGKLKIELIEEWNYYTGLCEVEFIRYL